MRDYYRGNGKMESGGELYPATLEQMIKVADGLDSHVTQLQKESSDTFRDYMKVKAQLDARQLYPWSESLPVQLPPSRTRRIYIAGPMSGIEDHNFPAFNAQAEILRKEGWTVLNPADHGVVEGAEWGDYLRHDLAGLVTCEAIYLLPGWEGSRGARLEVTVAEQLGLIIMSAEAFDSALIPVPGKPGQEPSNVIAWQYTDAFGSHVTDDYDEIQYTPGIEEVTPLAPAKVSFQSRVESWMMACFGPVISNDRTERNHRFLEEALELVQACDCSREHALELVNYVYSRPVGRVAQEVGGVAITLTALCRAHGIDLEFVSEEELSRIWRHVDAIREKQKSKPRFGALSEAYS